MVTAVWVIGRGVEARLVVGDADPCGDVVGAHAERAQLPRQLAALENARARHHRQQRTRQPRNAIHRSMRMTVLSSRTLFYVSATDLPPRAALQVCRARIFVAILIAAS